MTPEHARRDSASTASRIVPWLLLAAYLVATLVLLVHHENWRDEAQGWLMAKQLGPLGLLDALSYEGHPCLWYLMLMPLAKLGLPYQAVNAFSMVTMGVAAWLVLFRSPFPLPARVLVLASPLFLYYYSVIGRSYCLVVLLLALLAVTYPGRLERPVPYCLLVALLLQTHILVAFACLALCLGLLVEVAARYRTGRDAARLRGGIAALLLPLASAGLLLYEFRNVRYAVANLYATSATPSEVPGLIAERASANASALFGPSLWPIVAAMLLAFLVLALRRGRRAAAPVAAVVATLAWMQYMTTFRYGGATARYLLVDLAVTLWACWVLLDGEVGPWHATWLGRSCVALVVTGAALSAIALDPGCLPDLSRPYSDAPRCAAYLETLDADVPVVEAETDFIDSVAAYLGDREVYNPYARSTATWVDRDQRDVHDLTFAELKANVRAAYPQAGGFYLVTGYPLRLYGCVTDLDASLAGTQPVYDTKANLARSGESLLVSDEYFSVYYVSLS
jgi:hypothetical protein